jgi:hypothetical protein
MSAENFAVKSPCSKASSKVMTPPESADASRSPTAANINLHGSAVPAISPRSKVTVGPVQRNSNCQSPNFSRETYSNSPKARTRRAAGYQRTYSPEHRPKWTPMARTPERASDSTRSVPVHPGNLVAEGLPAGVESDRPRPSNPGSTCRQPSRSCSHPITPTDCRTPAES